MKVEPDVESEAGFVGAAEVQVEAGFVAEGWYGGDRHREQALASMRFSRRRRRRGRSSRRLHRRAITACRGTALPSGTERRLSPIEVHPEFSEAPHLRSSIPHTKTDFSKIKLHPDE